MGITEMTQSANNGDVSAMIQLGNHYLEETEYSEALTWFSKAAESNLFGAAGAMAAARAQAVVYEDSDSEEMRRYLFMAFQHCTTLLQTDPKNEALHPLQEMAVEAYPAIILGIASSFYDEGNIVAAKNMLQNQDEPEAKVLLGLCYMKDRSGDVNDTRYAFEAAYPLLRIIEVDDVSALSVRYQHIALMNLAILYRLAGELGIRSIPSDINRAYECVLKASTLPDLPDAARQSTNAELSKYNKKFFGGYSYNG